jgi:hypothetical protein
VYTESPVSAATVYIGQTGHSVDARLKEHQLHIHLEHQGKSAMVVHSVDLGHRIQFHNTYILATMTQYIVMEVTETELHPDNMNREMVFHISKSWKPLICSLKKPDTRPTGLHRTMHAQQSSPEATGSMHPPHNGILFSTPTGS